MSRFLFLFILLPFQNLFSAGTETSSILLDSLDKQVCIPDSIESINRSVFKKNFQSDEIINYGYWFKKVSDSRNACILPQRICPWLAAGEVTLLNIGVWTFDRYALKGDYAKISWNSIKQNFKTGFVWDNDGFDTNLFFHPYHGSLYYNAARANGMNFWWSIPYAAVGSLTWEFLLESEPAAINDWLSTTLGGVCLGEITWRLSDLLVDQRSRGKKRFLREFGIWCISPVRGFNRLITGEASQYAFCEGKSMSPPDLVLTTAFNYRYLCESSDWRKKAQGAELEVNVVYGNPMEQLETVPYSFFTLDMRVNFMNKQPIIGGFQAKAMLWGHYWETHPDYGFLLGIFQHFNFLNSDAMNLKTRIVPYKISEAAAFGIGAIGQIPIKENRLAFFCDVYMNGVLLGGSYTDYYRAVDRDYNLGSGYSFKLMPGLNFRELGDFRFLWERIQLFTWKGYGKDQNLAKLSHPEMLYLNAQGDKGNTALNIYSLQLTIPVYRQFRLNLKHTLFIRRSAYAYYPTVRYRVSETKLGLIYRFH